MSMRDFAKYTKVEAICSCEYAGCQVHYAVRTEDTHVRVERARYLRETRNVPIFVAEYHESLLVDVGQARHVASLYEGDSRGGMFVCVLSVHSDGSIDLHCDGQPGSLYFHKPTK